MNKRKLVDDVSRPEKRTTLSFDIEMFVSFAYEHRGDALQLLRVLSCVCKQAQQLIYALPIVWSSVEFCTELEPSTSQEICTILRFRRTCLMLECDAYTDHHRHVEIPRNMWFPSLFAYPNQRFHREKTLAKTNVLVRMWNPTKPLLKEQTSFDFKNYISKLDMRHCLDNICKKPHPEEHYDYDQGVQYAFEENSRHHFVVMLCYPSRHDSKTHWFSGIYFTKKPLI